MNVAEASCLHVRVIKMIKMVIILGNIIFNVAILSSKHKLCRTYVIVGTKGSFYVGRTFFFHILFYYW